MLARHSRCESRARVSIVLGLLSTALVFGASSVSAQTMTVPGGEAGAAGTAPPAGANAEEAPAPAAAVGRPFGFTHNEFVDLSQTYETNPLGLNQNQADTFTDLSLGIGLHDHTPRFTGDLQYSLSGIAYARNSGYDQLYNSLYALGTAVIVPEHVFLRATAFASPVLLNGLGPVAAPGVPVAPGVNSGLTDTYGYSVSPDLTFRLENFARATTIVTQSAIYFVEPQGPEVGPIGPLPGPPSQVVAYSAVEQLTSGSDFARLHWQLTGSGDRFIESGIDFDVISGGANATYAITRDVAVLGSGGYETFSSNQELTQRISGAFWYGGLRLGLGPRGHADLEAGEQFGGPSYIGDVNYQISPLTSIVGTLTDTILTPAAALLGGFGQLGVNSQGNFFNTNYQVGSAPPATISNVTGFTPGFPGGLAITDIISRYRFANLSLVHLVGRTQLRLSGYRYDFESVVQNAPIPGQTTIGGEFAAFRNINPFLSGGVTIDYSDNTILGGSYATLSGSALATYQLSPFMQIYFRVAYIESRPNAALVAASPITSNITDTAITIGIHRNFF
jgi:uncharacterized protein (PEP-CTERM system associated)